MASSPNNSCTRIDSVGPPSACVVDRHATPGRRLEMRRRLASSRRCSCHGSSAVEALLQIRRREISASAVLPAGPARASRAAVAASAASERSGHRRLRRGAETPPGRAIAAAPWSRAGATPSADAFGQHAPPLVAAGVRRDWQSPVRTAPARRAGAAPARAAPPRRIEGDLVAVVDAVGKALSISSSVDRRGQQDAGLRRRVPVSSATTR